MSASYRPNTVIYKVLTTTKITLTINIINYKLIVLIINILMAICIYNHCYIFPFLITNYMNRKIKFIIFFNGFILDIFFLKLNVTGKD